MRTPNVVFAPLVAAVAAVVFISGQASSAGPRVDPHKEARFSVEAARQEVRHRVPTATGPLSYGGTRDRPGIRVHVFEDADTTAYVDVADGHLAMLSVRTPLTGGRPSRVTHDQALSVALDYLATIDSPTDGLDAIVTDATGSDRTGFTVTLTRHKGEITLPDYRMVEIDAASGGVVSMIDVRRPYADPEPASVSANEAKALATRQVAAGTASEPVLLVSWDVAGNQRLVWAVPVASTTAGAVVTLDAYTGLAIDPAQE